MVVASSKTPLLSFDQLECTRDNRVLFSGIDYTINTGDIVQITGPNGTGKTTLLRTIIGLFKDYQGNILWRGEPIDTVRYDFTTQLLFIGHLAGIKKNLTPRENLQFLANLQGCYSLEQIDHALEQVGLYGYEDMPGYQLSAGQNRRVALARLYLNSAMVWVLDEPYTALDVQGVNKLEKRFNQHVERGGCIIFTSHQSPSIARLRTLSLEQYLPVAYATE